MVDQQRTRRVIQVGKRIIGPSEPLEKTVQARPRSDFPHVAAEHLDLAERLTSPLLMGPPLCEQLVALVEHVFSEQEAAIARHLGKVAGRRARTVARAERQPVEQVEPILTRLADERRVIGATGSDSRRRYRLMPIIPGMFELVLISESPETMSAWHRRFAELIEALFETGYLLDYQRQPSSLVRFYPVGAVADVHPMALPSDKLDVVLERFDTFGVGNCQCRLSSGVVDQGCDKPLAVCTAMGPWAERGIDDGWLRRVSRREIVQIKREAESHGLVTWMLNVDSPDGQVACSCCGCCCKAMRMVNQFNAPGIMAPPHFMPRFDMERCRHCGLCAKACPMGAITVDLETKTLDHAPARCIGCGLCWQSCDRQQAIEMAPVPDHRLPYKSWYRMLLSNAPQMLTTSFSVWRGRG